MSARIQAAGAAAARPLMRPPSCRLRHCRHRRRRPRRRRGICTCARAAKTWDVSAETAGHG
eukprot:scaffold126957_cov54-Phaeocystis_antarctica.AAC.1